MILQDVIDVMNKNRLSKEQAIMKILLDWSLQNNIVMTAVVSFEDNDQWAMATVATIPQETPVDIVKTCGHLFQDMIQKVLVDRARSS